MSLQPETSFEKGLQESYRKTAVPEFFVYDEVAHHQVCNFIKKRLQQRCSTVNFAKFLKAPSRTPQVNASAFDRLNREKRISMFSQKFLLFDIAKPLHVPYRS